MTDMHVHILPGVDDGAKDPEMTAQMMQRAKDAGICRIVATPHVYCLEDQARNRAAARRARQIAQMHGIELAIGCEFNYRALIKADLSDLDSFCLGRTKSILLEFSNDHPMPGWEGTISEILDYGYLPVIAHPERYRYIQRDMGLARMLCELGCELQVDACGLMAGAFSAERKTARRLLSDGLVSYIASDAHTPKDYDDYEKARRTFSREWPTDNQLTRQLKNL